MIPTPKRYARYRTDKHNTVLDMRHYDQDTEMFIDENGTVWNRTALTVHAYGTALLARAELEQLESTRII